MERAAWGHREGDTYVYYPSGSVKIIVKRDRVGSWGVKVFQKKPIWSNKWSRMSGWRRGYETVREAQDAALERIGEIERRHMAPASM